MLGRHPLVRSPFPKSGGGEKQGRKENVCVLAKSQMTVLHFAAGSDHLMSISQVTGVKPESYASMKTLLDMLPESEHLRIVSMQDEQKKTALHYAARSKNPESIKLLLALYPGGSERLQAVKSPDIYTKTVLHYAAVANNYESIKYILNLYPESERLKAMSVPDDDEKTALDYVERSGNLAFIEATRRLLPLESQQQEEGDGSR